MGLAGFEVEVQRETRDGGLATEDMTLSMGPQHPSTHGVLRFVVRADGEVMKEAIPDIGYLHRSIEKIAEKVGWHGFMPYTDRVDYVAAMPCNQGWAMAAERLAAIEVPKRGEYCRVIATEFSRIHSHLLSVGSMAMDIGAYTPFTHAIREREYINDLLQDRPPVPGETSRRARHCEGAAQLQAAGGRLLRAPRERARRHGLVRGERRDGVPLPLQDPHGLLRRHQHRPEGEPQPHDRRPD